MGSEVIPQESSSAAPATVNSVSLEPETSQN
jgi:hypothetical protein